MRGDGRLRMIRGGVQVADRGVGQGVNSGASPIRAGRSSRRPSSRSQAEIRRASSSRPTATYASASR